MAVDLGSSPRLAAAQGGQGIPSKPCRFKLGIASYTFRKFSLDETLAMTKRAGLTQVCLKDFHLPMTASPEDLAAAAAKVAKEGLVFTSVGVVSMTNDVAVAKAFDYAKAAGVKLIVIAPSAAMLPLIEEKVKQFDISVAIHNHGPGDKHFPTPESAVDKIKDMDKRIGLCIDIGHTVRIGADLIASVEKYGNRFLDVHIKDVSEASAKGKTIALGHGVIDIPAFLRALMKINYQGTLSYEYEADEKDPLPGLCESVGYTRGALAAIG